MPRMPNSVSVMSAPEKRLGRLPPRVVMRGIRVLRKACLLMTAFSGTPFARAVRI